MAKRQIIDPSVRKKIFSFADLLKKSGISVEKLILYGSYAKGIARDTSDIDLCVVSPSFSKNANYYFKKLWHLAAKVDPSLEPIPFSPQELTDKYSTLVSEIRKYGREINI